MIPLKAPPPIPPYPPNRFPLYTTGPFLAEPVRLRWICFWRREVILRVPSATSPMLVPAPRSHARPVGMSTLTQYYALLLETHPYYHQTVTVVQREAREGATRSDLPPIGRAPSTTYIENACDHIEWIMRMMELTMPVALEQAKEALAATYTRIQWMKLADGAMRLSTFVELANSEAMALDAPQKLELEYRPDTCNLNLRFVDVSDSNPPSESHGDEPSGSQNEGSDSGCTSG